VVAEVVGCTGERGGGGALALKELGVPVENLEGGGAGAGRCGGETPDLRERERAEVWHGGCNGGAAM